MRIGQGRGKQRRQITTPTSVPIVPGAKGASPEPNPVARNVISFSFKIPPTNKSNRDIPVCFAQGTIQLTDITVLRL